MTAAAETPPGAARPLLSVVIVSWNTRDALRACLASVERHLTGIPWECIVVDNASVDGSPEMVAAEFPVVRLLHAGSNLGFGRGCNVGMREARGRFVLLLNSDAELLDDSARALIALLERAPGTGVVGTRLVFPDGRCQVSARRFPSAARLLVEALWLYRLLPRARRARWLLGPHFDHASECRVDWLVGAYMLLRREVFEDTGGFDERIFLYGEEVEWCRRIRAAGWELRFSPLGAVRHHAHLSADQLLGGAGRLDHCLDADDRLLVVWNGRAAATLAIAARVLGAGLRVGIFGLRARLGRDDAYGRSLRAEARLVLAHYGRRPSKRDVARAGASPSSRGVAA